MKCVSFLFLLAALIVPLGVSRTEAVDLRQDETISGAARASDFSLQLNLLGEKGNVYRPGEEIRISFQTTKDAYVVVYNIDADGYVQLLYPEDGRPILSKRRTTYFLPPPGKNLTWEAGSATGVEYIHALAVTESGRLDEDELYFLSRGDRLSEEKRLRIASDPYLAFNMIDEEIVRDAESDPPATDHAHFFVNKQVDYPRYLCAKCHSPEKLPDPYAMQCPEIVIAEITYEQKPRYPYAPLYDVRYSAGAAEEEEDYSSDRYADALLDYEDDDEDDVHYRLHISYSTYNPYAPYFGPTLLFYDPFYWDPFWWGFGWSWTWGYGYWRPGWWYPHHYSWAFHYRYPWWGWGDHWCCCGYGYRCRDDYRFHPPYGRSTPKNRYLAYRQTNTDLNRRRSIEGSRLTEARSRDLDRRLDRSNLQRRSADRSIVKEPIRMNERSAVRSRELGRRIIYGNDRSIGETRRALDRRTNAGATRETREAPNRIIPDSQRRIDARRAPERRQEPARDRSGDSKRTIERRSEPERRSGDTDRRESARDRSSGSTTRDKSKSLDRRSSRAPNDASVRTRSSSRSSSVSRSSPARASREHSVSRSPSRASSARVHSAPARSAGRSSSPPPSSSPRSSGATATKRARSR